MNEGKHNQAETVRTERIELRVPLSELQSINAHCLTYGLNRSAFIRSTAKLAILNAASRHHGPVFIDARDAAVMAAQGGTIEKGEHEAHT